jgi:GT2 family glycosyltransferase
MIGAVILNWNTKRLLYACIQSLQQQTDDSSLRIMVVDNNSSDGSLEAFSRDFPGVHLLKLDTNVGFARANNAGVNELLRREPTVSEIYVANADTRLLARDTLAQLRDKLANGEGALIAPRLLNVDGSLQLSCAPFPTVWPMLAMATGLARVVPDRWRVRMGTRWSHGGSRCVPWVKGAAFLISVTDWRALGGFCEDEFMYGEDIDLCWRAKLAGLMTYYAADVAIEHVDDAASSLVWSDPERATRVVGATARFLARNYGRRRSRSVATIAEFGATVRALLFRLIRRPGGAEVQEALKNAWRAAR